MYFVYYKSKKWKPNNRYRLKLQYFSYILMDYLVPYLLLWSMKTPIHGLG